MTTNGRGLLIAALLLLCTRFCSADWKAKWTPADKEEGSGPLPQSTKKRMQLLHLEQVIAKSPNPTATLKKVSASMNMKPHELDRMLKRNAADIMASNAGVDKASPTTSMFRRKMSGMRKKLASWLAANLAPLVAGLLAAFVHHHILQQSKNVP